MRHSQVVLALPAAVAASIAFAITWLRGGDGPAANGSRLESAPSAGARRVDPTAAASDSIDVFMQKERHYCHWHQEAKLNSPEWWLAEYDRGVQTRRPTLAQIAELEM